jgi:hypothetical protein
MSNPTQAFEDFLASAGIPVTDDNRAAFAAFWQQQQANANANAQQNGSTAPPPFDMNGFAQAFASAIPQPVPIDYAAFAQALITGQRAAQGSEVPMEKMESWGGDKDKLDEFISQCELRFLAKPFKYSNAASQILFATGVLTGTPRKLVDEERKLAPALQGLWIQSWPAFVAQLNAWFGDADPRAAARNKLQALKQTKSVLKYWTDFAVLAAKLPWGDEALKDSFYSGLKSDIKDELARMLIPPATLLALKDYAVQIDTRIHQRDYERRHEDRSSGNKSHDDGNKSKDKGKDNNKGQQRSYGFSSYSAPIGKSSYNAPTSSGTSSGPKPMDIDAVFQGKVTPAEKERRRRLNLCAYDGCNQPGNCKKLKEKEDAKGKKKFSNNGVLYTVTGPEPSPPAGN